jgi:acylglycerol lipase
VPVAFDVAHEEGDFDGYGLVRIFEQWWRPAKGPVRASLVLVHGLDDHSTRYAELGNRLAEHGYAVHAFDLRGHGSSGGRRVYVESFNEYVEDLQSFVDSVRAREGGRPVFVLGHDLGGTIALEYVLEKKPQLAGLVVSGPLLQVDISGFRQLVTKAAGTVLPLLATMSIDVDHFSQDPEVVRACKEDPLIDHGNGPVRTAREILNAMSSISAREEEVGLPVLILHGGADAVAAAEASRALFTRAGSKDKTLRVYDGMFHDLWREPAREQVLEDLAAWLDAR